MKLTQVLAMRGVGNPLRDRTPAEYWASRDVDTIHSPTLYVKPDETTSLVLDDVLKVVERSASFLEIGCNAGRNLKYLYDKGYKNLAGIEINAPAVEKVLKSNFPDMYASSKFYVGNAAEQIKKIPSNSYDVVFSNAVLVHIHPKDASLFQDMVRVSKKYISFFTDENSTGGWPHDYDAIFKKQGCTLVQHKLFYGMESKNSLLLPKENLDEKKHYFDACIQKIYIKNVNG